MNFTAPTVPLNQPPFEVAIVLPCLNEAKTLAACIKEARDAITQASIAGEVIVADNGSTDDSPAIAEANGARVVNVPEKGYGSALRHGIEAAKARYIVMGDADMSYDFSHLPRFLARLRDGADLVMGNRFQGGILNGAMPWKNRYIGNPILSGLGQLLFRSKIRDFHCGLRGFSIDAYRRMNLRTTGMEFASEMVIKASLMHMRVEEVPTTLRPDGRDRAPHLRPWRDGWRHLRFMLLFSPRWLFFYPGLILVIAGLGASIALLPGPRTLGHVTFDVHSLLFSTTAVLVGFQSISFAVLSKRFTLHAGLRAPDPQFDRAIDFISLESGLMGGMALILGGLVCSIAAVWQWQENQFGNLIPGQVLRMVIPGCMLMALGVQSILTCFFLGVLGLDRRPEPR